MNQCIKVGEKWCKIARAATPEDLAQLNPRFRHPFQAGTKVTRCGKLAHGNPHPQPLDACERCEECFGG